MDTIVSLLLIGAVIYYWYKDHIAPVLPWGKTVKSLPRLKHRSYRSKSLERPERGSGLEPHMNAMNAGSERSSEVQAGIEAATDSSHTITLDDLRNVAKAYYLLGTGKGKQATIEEVWQCSKGAGKQWKKGSYLVDLAGEGGTILGR